MADALSSIKKALESDIGISSGVTAGTTTDDTAVEIIAADSTRDFRFFRIINDGSVAGFYSIDSGTTWDYLPANCIIEDSEVLIQNKSIQVKRIAGGSDLSGVYVSMR
jgi:hypothetical protein